VCNFLPLWISSDCGNSQFCCSHDSQILPITSSHSHSLDCTTWGGVRCQIAYLEREREMCVCVCVCVYIYIYIYIYIMRAMCESSYLKLKFEPVLFFSIWRIKQLKNHDFLIRLLRVQLCKNSLSFSLELQKWAFDD
jgi:hypothetical protein